ncbi:hypothetical protein K402DRAFT_48679 [Aulographum hederae CBS 113979]|uniref:Uncharacterized protein n=1 Tax=Aulographum hederae CBS 113979 TaxID=1176131 RepID=A0A6G1H2I6_9PEZI|nr:hypothetical protein K402DRAFT_48679 [Aulographum hederae CBS 113979]
MPSPQPSNLSKHTTHSGMPRAIRASTSGRSVTSPQTRHRAAALNCWSGHEPLVGVSGAAIASLISAGRRIPGCRCCCGCCCCFLSPRAAWPRSGTLGILLPCLIILCMSSTPSRRSTAQDDLSVSGLELSLAFSPVVGWRSTVQPHELLVFLSFPSRTCNRGRRLYEDGRSPDLGFIICKSVPDEMYGRMEEVLRSAIDIPHSPARLDLANPSTFPLVAILALKQLRQIPTSVYIHTLFFVFVPRTVPKEPLALVA